jgi:hypothetical protein
MSLKSGALPVQKYLLYWYKSTNTDAFGGPLKRNALEIEKAALAKERDTLAKMRNVLEVRCFTATKVLASLAH